MIIPYSHFKQLFIDLFSENADFIVSVSSMVVACLALWFTYRRDYITKKHYELSVEPKVKFDFEGDEVSGVMKLYLKNKGLGPAILDSFVITYGDSRYEFPNWEDYDAIISHISEFKDAGALTRRKFAKEEVIQAGENCLFLCWELHPNFKNEYHELKQGFRSLECSLKYHSMYKVSFNENY